MYRTRHFHFQTPPRMSQFSSGTDMYHNLWPGKAQPSTIFELPEKAYILWDAYTLGKHT
jgi:hypothetical protein